MPIPTPEQVAEFIRDKVLEILRTTTLHTVERYGLKVVPSWDATVDLILKNVYVFIAPTSTEHSNISIGNIAYSRSTSYTLFVFTNTSANLFGEVVDKLNKYFAQTLVKDLQAQYNLAFILERSGFDVNYIDEPRMHIANVDFTLTVYALDSN